MTKAIKLWLRTPRRAWRNDGGEIPREFRGRCRRWPGSKTVVIACPLQKVRVGHWIVAAGAELYAFSPSDVRQLYSRVPQPEAQP